MFLHCFFGGPLLRLIDASRAANSTMAATELSIFNFGCVGRSQIVVWCGGELGSNALRMGRNSPL